MQVLLFIGEEFYPRPNLGDFVQVMPHFPTDDELLSVVVHLKATRDRYSLHPQWATAMSVDPVTNETKMVHWVIDHDEDQEKLKQRGCAAFLGLADGTGWYGVRNEDVEWNDSAYS